MDEALLTGRFSVQPDMTRRGMSVRSTRSGTSEDTAEGHPLSREGSARPRSSSRADTCLRRSRSAFDVELFRRQLRLNKSLSRNRFKQELLDLALHPIVIRATSARAEPEGSEFDSLLGSARERVHKENSGLLKDHDLCDSDRKDVPGEDRVVEELKQTRRGESPHKATKSRNDDLNDKTPTSALTNPKQVKSEHELSGQFSGRSTPKRTDHPTRKATEEEEEDEDELEDVDEEKEEDGKDSPTPSPRDSSPARRQRYYKKRGPRRRQRWESQELNVVSTHRAVGRTDRVDGAIVIHPRRNRTRYDVTSELMSPRRFALPVRDELTASSLLCYSSSPSSSEDEELMNLMGHTPLYHSSEGRRERGGGESEGRDGGGGLGSRGRSRKSHHRRRRTMSDSEQFDTDLEIDDGSEFNEKERLRSITCLDTDFGHLTYESACAQFQVIPRKRIMQQLMTSRLQINYCGLSNSECKALALALLRNSCLDEVDLASNGMDGGSVAYIAHTFHRNIFITKLNLSGNHLQEEGCRALGEMLKVNTWLTHLSLSECQINDNEIGFLTKGIQENSTVVCLNLSKNKLETHAGRHLGTALGVNNGLECLNLSWNMLRGSSAVAVCNSLQRNHTLQEMNLAWNGLGFQGSLAISEALKVNQSLKKLDLSNNRVDWDCTPYLAKALTLNRTLEVLELGHNPISMEGCMKLLEAVDRPSSALRLLSLAAVPISNKIAFKATEISKARDFSMEHGGVISTRDIFGMRRIKREDPLTLLIRYLSTMGIRVVDLFRVFDTNSKLYVSQANFIRGLKRVRAPLDEEDMLRVARRMRSDKRGDISYHACAGGSPNPRCVGRPGIPSTPQRGLPRLREIRARRLSERLPRCAPKTNLTVDSLLAAAPLSSHSGGPRSSRELAANVRSHIREERKEDRRLQLLELKKREERRRILQSDLPLYAPASFSYLPALDSMYGSNVFSRHMDALSSGTGVRYGSRLDSVVSQRGGYDAYSLRGMTPSSYFFPTLDTPGTVDYWSSTSPFLKREQQQQRESPNRRRRVTTSEYGSRRSPMTLVRHGTKGLPGSRRPVSLLRSPADELKEKGVNTNPTLRKTRSGSLNLGSKDPAKQKPVSQEKRQSNLANDLNPRRGTQDKKRSLSFDTKGSSSNTGREEKEQSVSPDAKASILKTTSREKKQSTSLDISPKSGKEQNFSPAKDSKSGTHEKRTSLESHDAKLKADWRERKRNENQKRKEGTESVEPHQTVSSGSLHAKSPLLPQLAGRSKNLVQAGDVSKDLRSSVDKARHREAVGRASPGRGLLDARSGRGPVGLNGSKRGL
ncbi:hypothetical protein ACOMHN_008307 [Nucella lapillus]